MTRDERRGRQPEEAWAERFSSGATSERWSELVRRVGAAAAVELVSALAELAPPERIAELAEIERRQAEWGAGFYGLLPDQITAPLPVPKTDDELLGAALRLAEIRRQNHEAIRTAMPRYVLSFRGAPFPAPARPLPAGWSLALDLSGIEAVLGALERGRIGEADARRIARMPAFQEMIRHRRELGYVPEPLIDEEGLARCLAGAASRDPLERIWIWLHPGNYFDLADLAVHRTAYRRLIRELCHRANDVAALVLDPIERHAPAGTTFSDRLSLAVGWGIAGWATSSTGGINIEHFKDDHEALLRTLRHETFHRFQLRICPRNPDAAPDSFEGITRGVLERPKDAALYRALAYVMLEGSATFVAGVPDPSWAEQIAPGLDILGRIASADGDVDALLNEGLRSNGPFYGLGAALSERIVAAYGPRGLGASLQAGAPAFVRRALAAAGPSIDVEPTIRERIDRLSAPR